MLAEYSAWFPLFLYSFPEKAEKGNNSRIVIPQNSTFMVNAGYFYQNKTYWRKDQDNTWQNLFFSGIFNRRIISLKYSFNQQTQEYGYLFGGYGSSEWSNHPGDTSIIHLTVGAGAGSELTPWREFFS